MKKVYLFQMTILSVFLVSFLVIAGCGSGGGGAAAPGYAFQDNFDSYTAAHPWTPAGGWAYGDSSDSGAWSIENSGLTGNGLEFIGSGVDFLVSSYTGDDYTVTVRVRPTSIVVGQGFGIFARYDAGKNCYGMVVFNKSPGPGNSLAIYKFYNSDGSNGAPWVIDYLATALDTDTYYTLTLKVSGSVPNPVITATVTDGVNSQTLTYTDDNSTYGSAIPSGKAGVWVYASSGIPVIYDDFTVAEP